jgi:hypothetical protein
MTDKNKAQAYVDSQRSLHLYKHAREAFVDVLTALPEEDFERVTHNLILTVLHEGAIAQVMHFEPVPERFRVLQLTIPHDASPETLRWVTAHELGHVLQGRNWREGDGETLEHDATAQAARWGFEKTTEIEAYLENYRERFSES